MKRILIQLTSIFLLTAHAGCSGTAAPETSEKAAASPVSLTLWTYPVGAWGNASTVSGLLADFRRAYPSIDLHVEFLKYETGDEQVEQAIRSGSAPDLILEGPERLVSNWGARGLMADLSDLMERPEALAIYENTRNACQYSNGEYYVYPLCMTPQCMAVNYDLFQAAGALQYLDEETHTWTTEGFIQAVNALYAHGQTEAGAIYCGGQGGDQGTRALVNNLYGGTFTDPAHTRYTLNSAENIRALELLQRLPGIRFDPELVGGSEIQQFCAGKLAMAFCWNVSIEIQQVVRNPELEFKILPMAFPTSTGEPRLQGGIWGFGIFDNGDPERIAAAKTFIHYFTGNDQQYRRAVLTSGNWPVRDVKHIYVNDELMSEYSIFMPYVGDYYQITPNWSQARTAWWTMLQKIAAGSPPADAVREFEMEANRPPSHTDH